MSGDGKTGAGSGEGCGGIGDGSAGCDGVVDFDGNRGMVGSYASVDNEDGVNGSVVYGCYGSND